MLGKARIIYVGIFVLLCLAVGFLLIFLPQLMFQPTIYYQTEELEVQGHTWWKAGEIELTVRNTGTRTLTLSLARVNGVLTQATFNPATLSPGATSTVTITVWNFSSGVRYEFSLYTATGNTYTYVATAP